MRSLRDVVSSSVVDPLKALSFGLISGLILLSIVGSVVWSMYGTIHRIGIDEFRLQGLCGTINHLNEVLTMSARMAAATGDPKWIERYRAIEPELDNAITEVAVLARAEYEKNYAAQTKLAYTKLIEIESLALALASKERPEEASKLLFGEEYDYYKGLYSQGISEMTSAVQTRITREIQGFRARIWAAGLLGVASLAILVVAWFGVSLVVKSHLNHRKQAERALENEKERLSVTLRSIGDGVITTDICARITLMNRVAEQLTAWKEHEVIERPLGEAFVIINEKTRQPAENPVEKVLKSGTIHGLANHTVLVARDGRERIIEDSAAPIRDRDGNVVGVVLVFRDTTEERHMLREVLKAEKLESVGLLAGGIAHDFNNILAGIMGNISLAKMRLDKETAVLQRLSEAEKAVVRAKDLTQQLLTFSKGGAPIKKAASLPELLVEWVRFALRGSGTSCQFRIQTDLWAAEVDEAQISQVVHNLVVNAEQAMPDGGRIHLSAENYIENERKGCPLSPGKYVRISIEDEGTGVRPEHLQRIFDPYFTTKKTGSGLGLATSYTIVKRHGGHISVRSELEKGTTFEVFLPASENRAGIRNEARAMPKNGRGKILVMDDEDVVREVTSEMLKLLGYRVAVSKDGSEAIDLYCRAKEGGEPFDAVIMDLTIPGGIGGRETVSLLRDLDPQIKAIVCSGYSTDSIMGDFEKHGFCGVLAKPYNTEQMSAILHEVISGTKS